MTEKEFLDVFPHLKVDAELEALLGAVKVMKVAVNPQKDCLRVYIMSSQWIHKKHIYHLEEAIREQFFENANLRVKIIEKFRLSRQYTPENFMEVYRPSILLELKRYSMLEYNLFATADISFPEPETMELVMTDSVIAREKEGELIRLLEKIFCERCGFNLRVHPSFREAAESKVHKNSELRILEEARQILARSKVGRKAGFSGDFPEEGAAFPEGMSGADGMADAAFGMGNPEVPFLEDIPGGNAGMGQPGFPPQGAGDPAQASQGGAAAQAQGAGKGASGQAGNSQKNVGTKGQGGYKNGRGNFQKGRGKFQQGRYGDGPRPLKRSDNPDVIYGRDFDEDAIPIDSIAGEMGEVVIRGKVTSVEAREIRNEKTIYMFNVTDFTDTITVKMFLHNEQVPEIKGSIKAGAFLKLKGVTTIDKFDHEITIGSLAGIKKISDFTTHRMDNSPEKRVELHCHTKMSDMDGVTDASVLVKRAYQWGHPAIAITDHGVVQSFPEANHAYDDIVADYRKEYQKSHPDATKEEMKQVYPPFKVIYGCEAYLVDDVKGMVTNSKGQDLEQPYVVFDIETTGFSPAANRIIEIGAVRVEGGKIVSRFSEFVNPQVPIPFRIEQLTSINDSMVVDADTIEDVLPRFLEFSQGAVMVAHNAGFDMSFIMANCERLGLEREFTYVDTVGMARLLLPGLNRFKLDTVAKALNIPLLNHHRAVDDAACTAEIFVKFLAMCRDRDILDLDALNEAGKLSGDTIKKLPTYHAIILATSEEGRVNLYRLISKSHLDYYNRRPRIPKSVYLKHKEGLIIGSACEAGELYQALLRDEPEQEIARLVDFYDYLEIQPIGNNMFMVRDENRDDITSEEDLKNLNRRIVKLGEQFKKPVVATCDVHFIDPEDAIYREIITLR